jgi:hypothetical protein
MRSRPRRQRHTPFEPPPRPCCIPPPPTASRSITSELRQLSMMATKFADFDVTGKKMYLDKVRRSPPPRGAAAAAGPTPLSRPWPGPSHAAAQGLLIFPLVAARRGLRVLAEAAAAAVRGDTGPHSALPPPPPPPPARPRKPQMREACERYRIFMKRLELSDDPAAREYLRAINAQMLEGGFTMAMMFNGWAGAGVGSGVGWSWGPQQGDGVRGGPEGCADRPRYEKQRVGLTTPGASLDPAARLRPPPPGWSRASRNMRTSWRRRRPSCRTPSATRCGRADRPSRALPLHPHRRAPRAALARSARRRPPCRQLRCWRFALPPPLPPPCPSQRPVLGSRHTD